MILAFTDTETTHLSADIGEPWEIAVILRDHAGTETEHLWQIRPVRAHGADPEALRIGRFHERYAVPVGAQAVDLTTGHAVPMSRAAAITAITDVLRGATIIGSNPAFDDRHLRQLVGPGGAQWAYRPTCIATLVEGYLWATAPALLNAPAVPYSSRWLSRQVGVEPPAEGVAHTALGDARWARDVYDAVTDRHH